LAGWLTIGSLGLMLIELFSIVFKLYIDSKWFKNDEPSPKPYSDELYAAIFDISVADF
jgi:hypothetical protein